MTGQKIAFFDTKPYDEESFGETNRPFGFQIKYFPHHLNRDTAHLALGCDAVCAFVNDTLDSEVIGILKDEGVQVIALRSAGYNNIDLKAVYGRMHVLRVPAYSPEAVAEHAVALMMTLNRKTHRAYFRTRDGNFSINGLLGFNMHGKTAGVIGTGRIGRCLVSILKGFGMRILAYESDPDRAYEAAAGILYVPLAELYRQADVISLHCPLTPQTQYLINEESIASMKRGVMIINTGRGKLVKTQALIDALKSGQVGAAGLDVYEEESEYFFEDFSGSMIEDDVLARLLTFSNVLVTSHQGFFTREALANIAQTTLENLTDYFGGGPLKNEICYRCGSEICRKKKGQRCF